MILNLFLAILFNSFDEATSKDHDDDDLEA